MPAPQPLPLAFGEFRPDISDHNAAYTNSLSNVRARADGYGPINSVQGYTAALPSACRGYFYARRGDGSIAIFAGTATKLFLLDNTDFTWHDVTQLEGAEVEGEGVYDAVSSTGQWRFAQFNDLVIAVHANVKPQVYDLGASDPFADLGGDPPQAAYIAIVNRFVVLSGLLAQPYRVQWSGLNAVTTWTSGTNFSDFQDLPDGGANRGVVGGEYGLILQEGTIRRMIYAPGSEFVFQIDRVAEDRGLLAPYSLIAAGEKVFFLTPQGFVQSDASGVLNPIGKERVDRTFFAEYDAAQPQLMIGVADPSSNVAIWFYKTNNGGTASSFNKALIYDWVLQRWTTFYTNGEYTASLAKPGLTLEALDAISGSIEDLPFSLDDISTSTLPALSVATMDHVIGFFSGGALEATIETSEYSVPGRVLTVNGFTPLCDATSIYGSVGTRPRLNGNTTYYTEAVMNNEGFCPQLVEGRYIRGRIRIPADAVWTYAKGVIPEAKAGGK